MSLRSTDDVLRAPSMPLSQQWRNDIRYHSSNASNTTLDTVHRMYNRQLTPTSVRSLGSVSSSPLRIRSENLPPARIFNRDAFHSADDASLFLSPGRSSKHSSHKSSWGNEITPPRCRSTTTFIHEAGPLDDIDLNSLHVINGQNYDSDKENQEPVVEEPRLSFEIFDKEILSINQPADTSDQAHSRVSVTASRSPRTSRSFKRWISNLRPHPLRPKKTLTSSKKRWPLEDSPREQDTKSIANSKEMRSGHKKTKSASSAGFVDAVKAIAMAKPTTTTTTPVSRKSRRSNLFSRSNRSSKLSDNQAPISIDHPQGSVDSLEEAAAERSVQRRRTMEELVDSEASYVADMKVLIHAYFTLLATGPSSSRSTSMQFHQNVTEILRLHEDLLHQIRHSTRQPTQRTNAARRETPSMPKKHGRRSLEGNRITSVVTGLVHAARNSMDTPRPAHAATSSASIDTGSVAVVAKVFERMLCRFFIYEEYGAQYELMLREMVLTSKSINNWQAFERSIEALANSLAMSDNDEENQKKGLAFEDLLIKPIQRICKYPLLFEELYSNTHDIDDAETRMELSKLLCRLRELNTEINKATNDRDTQARIQRAWRLQDLLILPKVSTSPASLRLLGHPILCGVLYVAWESETDVCGEYALCVLYRSHLLLAIQQSDTDHYNVVAIIGLSDIQLSKADNGKGLQCHTASFSWKVVFEASQQLYELIFCACSLEEEQAWTRTIVQYSEKASRAQKDYASVTTPISTMFNLNAEALGPVFGIFGSVTRRLSIQRAATVHSRINGAQVIIRNTTATKENRDENDSIFGSIGRSKSVMTASRVPILAPKRSDRSRMESSLADVWSRDRLPFPGMSSHKADHPLRASASSMMRRLSRASISSTFSKRSVSTASFADMKPGASSVPDLQEIGEGEDERDFLPRLDAYQSLRSTPGFEPDGELQGKLHRSGKIVRTGTVKGVRLADATNTTVVDRRGAGAGSRYEVQTVRVESTDKGSPRIVRNRRSVPGGLLMKRFSMDGLRAGRG